jgi:hypothetical protein
MNGQFRLSIITPTGSSAQLSWSGILTTLTDSMGIALPISVEHVLRAFLQASIKAPAAGPGV